MCANTQNCTNISQLFRHQENKGGKASDPKSFYLHFIRLNRINKYSHAVKHLRTWHWVTIVLRGVGT